jgi:L-seryl-tRNA(Ser) seleniumtransferase
MANRATRRGFLQATAALPAAGALAAPRGGSRVNPLSEANVYTRLGVKPVINAVGTVTVLGGSIMPPEVVRAMDEASRYFVSLPDLQQKVGARIAELLDVPAAMVTAGAASAISVGTAACLAGGDPKNIRRLPDTTGLKGEVIQQKSHAEGYEPQILIMGAKIIQVETRDELLAAINDRTAMLFFTNTAEPNGQIKRDEWIRIGKQRGVPTFNDAAADVPPREHLSQYVKEGFDLVTFSGGKGLLGPQCSGLLLGRKDLIEAGIPAISPNGGVGRGMKVGKEEIIGVLAAVERYLKVDHDAEMRVLEGRVSHILDVMSKIRGMRATRFVPEIANHVPHVRLEWDGKLTGREVSKQLREGEPSIAIFAGDQPSMTVSVWMMQGDEHKIVARRLKEVFA